MSGQLKRVVFTSDINEEMFMQLVDVYNNIEEGEHLIIYISSQGGELSIAEAIIHLINEHSNITTLIAFREIMSAAAYIFFSVNCERSILDSTVGMMHLSRIPSVTMYEGNTIENDDTLHFLFHRNKKFDLLTKMVKLCGLTDSETETIKSNKTLYIDTPRLRKMLTFNKKK